MQILELLYYIYKLYILNFHLFENCQKINIFGIIYRLNFPFLFINELAIKLKIIFIKKKKKNLS